MQEVYVSNNEMKKMLIENNKWAYLTMVETLMECIDRGYYNASEEEIKELKKTYFENRRKYRRRDLNEGRYIYE